MIVSNRLKKLGFALAETRRCSSLTEIDEAHLSSIAGGDETDVLPEISDGGGGGGGGGDVNDVISCVLDVSGVISGVISENPTIILTSVVAAITDCNNALQNGGVVQGDIGDPNPPAGDLNNTATV